METEPLNRSERIGKIASAGESGEKAIPYSQRGIAIEPRVQSYLDSLSDEGTFLSDKAGTYSLQDLKVLTAETGVEYTMLTVDGTSYMIRGNERGTNIPQEILEKLYQNQGEFICHSHPFVGDPKPSKSDLNFLRSLTWQENSIIIEPSGEMVIYDQHGVKEKKEIPMERDEDYYAKMFE